METIYWLIEEDFGAYSFGLSQGKENIPAGAKTFSSEGDLNSAVAQAEKNAARSFKKQEKELAAIEEEANKPVKEDKKPPGQDKKDARNG